jgi:hypothetical protein
MTQMNLSIDECPIILPTALVDRWPSDRYKNQHSTIESALKHNVQDALMLHHDFLLLKEVERYLSTVPEVTEDSEELTKDQRMAIKRSGGVLGFREQLSRSIIQKDERLTRLMKYSDYPAMVMAAYPESCFMAKDRYWTENESITGPVLLRGISSGKIANHVRKKGDDYYFIETGYLGNYRCPNNRTGKKIYHRIVKNAMQHDTIMDVPDDRWNQLVNFNPTLAYNGWRNTGSKILIVLSTNKPFEYFGGSRDSWLKTVLATLKKHTDREIVIREKASRGERTNDTIYDALDNDVYALVTYNSIAAVEAIQSGIPAFALAPTAADPVGNKDLTQIENPNRPDEELVQRWLHNIAYSQFSLDEIITGSAWKMVLDNAQRSTLDY